MSEFAQGGASDRNHSTARRRDAISRIQLQRVGTKASWGEISAEPSRGNGDPTQEDAVPAVDKCGGSTIIKRIVDLCRIWWRHSFIE